MSAEIARRDHLLFDLYGPLAAFGDVALGSERSVQPLPTRSGVLGLIAAALGVDRGDAAGLSRLYEALGVACCGIAGQRMVDFHTWQKKAPSARYLKANGGPPITRKAALEMPGKLGSNISHRHYRMDQMATVCVWRRPDAPEAAPALAEIAAALDAPHFTPYLGRRACPLALPMRPTVVSHTHPVDALSEREAPSLIRHLPGARGPWIVEWEGAPESGALWSGQPVSQEIRRDHPGSRKSWQFMERALYRGVIERRRFD